MEKKFKKMKDYLEVTVTDSQPIKLPSGEDMVEIGEFDMTQVQKISLDKVDILLNFIDEQIKSGEKQIEEMNKQLEPIKDLAGIDEEVVAECKAKLKNGTQGFKTKMTALNKHLTNLDKKKGLEQQLEYVTTNLAPMKKELEQMREALA